MVRLTLTSNLTRGYSDTVEQQIRATHRGQAYFGHTGPFGATCGDCVFLGYWRQHQDRFGNATKSTRTGGCAKFFELTKRHGPVVPPQAPACRYFKRKESGTDRR